MPHITIEHVIMIPLLIAQIFVFPFVASRMASSWTDSHRDMVLKDVANYLASTIQQLYLSVNREEISAGNVTQASTLPQTISSYPYTATGSLKVADSSRVLSLSLTLEEVGNTVKVNAVLGSNALWIEESVFRSTSPGASVKVQKFANGTLLFSFG